MAIDDLLGRLTERLLSAEMRLSDLERQEPARGVGIGVWKSHRTAGFVFSAANTWTDIPFDTPVASESAPGIDYYLAGQPGENRAILVVDGLSDILYTSGCVRPLWTGTPGTRVLVATRIVISNDNGATWNEARCLQAVNERQSQANEVGTQHYMGTIRVQDGTRIKLQAWVGNTDMELAGWPTFDNPVSASIQMHGIGSRYD